MGKIIMFGNQKGGVGKTTLSCLTSNALASEPFNFVTSVIDADKQQSIIKRQLADLQDFDGIKPYEVHAMNLTQFQDKKRGIYQIIQDNDYVIVDVAGKLDTNLPVREQEIFKYLQYVHYLFIPFVPGNYSLESTLDYLKEVMKVKVQRQKEGRPIEVIGMINMSETRTLDDRFLMEEIENLKALINIKFMENSLNRYALFRNVDTLTSYFEPDSKDRAKQNFSLWFSEFQKIITHE